MDYRDASRDPRPSPFTPKSHSLQQIQERVLESSKKEREREREREGEREREWSSLEWSEWGRMREKRKIKEGDRDSGHVCEGEKQEKK